MDKIRHFLFMAALPFIIYFGSLQFVVMNGYCEAAPELHFDSNSLTVLEGGGYTDSTTFAMSTCDPNFICFGVDSMLQDINTKLYSEYGWDLEDVAIKIEDSLNEQTKETIINNIAADNAVPNGWFLLSTVSPTTYTGHTEYYVGQVDAATNTVTNVFPNILQYINESTIMMMLDIRRALVGNNTIKDFTSSNLYFSNSVSVNYGTRYSGEVIFDKPVVFISDGAMFPTSNSPTLPSYDSVIIDHNNNNVLHPYTTISRENTTLINGTTYQWGYVRSVVNGSSVGWNKLGNFPTYSEAIALLRQYDPYSSAYGYSTSNPTDLEDILSQLQDKWVTTDQLRQINDQLDKLTLGNISINGQNANGLLTDTDALGDLAGLIQQILEDNAVLNDELDPDPEPDPDPDPEPDPDPDPNPPDDDDDPPIPPDPVDVPDWIVPSFMGDLLSDDMFSMFRPIFEIVSVNNSSYDIWILIPAILMFLFILYIIISVF